MNYGSLPCSKMFQVHWYVGTQWPLSAKRLDVPDLASEDMQNATGFALRHPLWIGIVFSEGRDVSENVAYQYPKTAIAMRKMRQNAWNLQNAIFRYSKSNFGYTGEGDGQHYINTTNSGFASFDHWHGTFYPVLVVTSKSFVSSKHSPSTWVATGTGTVIYRGPKTPVKCWVTLWAWYKWGCNPKFSSLWRRMLSYAVMFVLIFNKVIRYGNVFKTVCSSLLVIDWSMVEECVVHELSRQSCTIDFVQHSIQMLQSEL